MLHVGGGNRGKVKEVVDIRLCVDIQNCDANGGLQYLDATLNP